MGPNAMIVREERPEGPTRRRVYTPTTIGYTLEVERWRLAIGGWETTTTEPLASVSVEGQP